MITIRNYHKASSLEEAWELNQKRGSKIIGGMLWLRLSKRTVQTAIDLSGLGLNTIKESDTEFRIGCMTTLRQLETHPGLNAYTNGAMQEAVRHIVGVQFRNLATVGGSVYGRFGFSDVLTMLLALDTSVELYKEGIVPLAEYAARVEYDRDILVRVIIKKAPVSCFYQSVRNTRTDFPVLAVAAVAAESGLRLSVGGRPGRAILLPEMPLPADADSAAALAKSVAAQVPTGSNMRGSAAYRTHLAEVLVQRAAAKLGGF